MEHYFFYIQNFVDSSYDGTNNIDHLDISTKFQNSLKEKFTDDQLVDLLIYAGYIPDLYPSDSSQETLYSKLIEVLVCEWAQRMNFNSNFVKQKASFEDVTIFIDGKAIVCDAKSFRLGRSQKAPNVKDFLKLEDIRKWLSRHKNKLGGLVTYPCRHEWTSSSDAYQYCTTKDAPTLMLPYKYLAFLLKYKNNYQTNTLKNLWNYNKLFPHILKKNIPAGNKIPYWNTINTEILKITNVDKNTFDKFMKYSENLINQCVQANLEILKNKKDSIKKKISIDINGINDIDVLREKIISYRTTAETQYVDNLISRIQGFRMDKNS